MIPTIGLIVGIYVIFRCLEVLCASGSRFSGPGGRAVASVAAILVMLVTGFLTVDLVLGHGGTQVSFEQPTGSAGEAGPSPAELDRARRDLQELIRKTHEGH